MARASSDSVARQIESLFEEGTIAGLTDRQLLERFTLRRDPVGEAAFAALVTRHGPLVLGLCRRMVGDRHHAEDAFQAVFLVLARRAQSIHDPDLLGNWLYGVAHRTARKARVRLARQRRNEEGDAMRLPEPGAPTPSQGMVRPAEEQALAREEAEALYDEIARLPGPFRLPVVLCYFEGLTLDEAAHRLRWPAGTVRSRLARARDKLRLGLIRRGVALPAAALAAALSPESASAQVAPPLCDATARAASQFTAGQVVSASATALAHAVLRSMFLHKLKFTVWTLLALGVFTTGAAFLGQSLGMMNQELQGPPTDPPLAQAAQPKGANQDAGPGRMIVAGRVLDPTGKPVPNATAMIYTLIKKEKRGVSFARIEMKASGQAPGDGSGRFRLEAPRTSSSRYERLGAVAIAPGYGAGWVDLDPDVDQPSADVPLRPERVIQGRVLDLQGQPAQGVEVTVQSMGSPMVRGNRVPSREYQERLHFWSPRVKDLPAWPKPVATDNEGRFTVHGVGRDLQVVLTIIDPRYAHQRIEVATTGPPDSKPLTLILEPAKTITGRVTYADTGKPVPHALVQVGSRQNGAQGPNVPLAEYETDAEGQFRANSRPGDRFTVYAHPPEGELYLRQSKEFDWIKTRVEYSVDLALPRGVVIRGKVTEEGTGKPIEGANLTFHRPDHGFPAKAVTRPDGAFELAVLPGSGCLDIRGPSDDYVLHEIGERMLAEGQPGGNRAYSHAFVFLDRKPGDTSPEVNVRLQRGETLQGRVVAPDGQPIQDGTMISRIILMGGEGGRRWHSIFNGALRNGRFELHGLAPDAEVPVFFLEPRRKLAATIHVSGKSAAGGPVTVRLEPCGTAQVRLVDPGGKPVAGRRDSALIWMVVTPGPAIFIRNEADRGRLAADQGTLAGIDPINYGNGPASDAEGRITFSALIPGATYRLYDFTPYRDPAGIQLRKEFTVKPGETLDLGDIRIEKPAQ